MRVAIGRAPAEPSCCFYALHHLRTRRLHPLAFAKEWRHAIQTSPSAHSAAQAVQAAPPESTEAAASPRPSRKTPSWGTHSPIPRPKRKLQYEGRSTSWARPNDSERSPSSARGPVRFETVAGGHDRNSRSSNNPRGEDNKTFETRRWDTSRGGRRDARPFDEAHRSWTHLQRKSPSGEVQEASPNYRDGRTLAGRGQSQREGSTDAQPLNPDRHERQASQGERSRQPVLDPWSLRIPPRKADSADRNSHAGGRRRNEAPRTSQITWSPTPEAAPSSTSVPPSTSTNAVERSARSERTMMSDRRWRQKEQQDGRRVARQAKTRGDDEDVDAKTADRIEAKQARKAARKLAKEAQTELTPITLPPFISVGHLATALRVRVDKFTRKLKALGFDEVLVDHILDAETAGLVATEFGFEPTLPKENLAEDLVALPEPDDKSLMPSRPPVITIMGHVDHGKTTLLDWLRKSSVVETEYGGITQHIGAFTVPMPSGREITFLDTPGHAAFLSMRARGANVTDIVILVVAADDSVKPQTLEAIKHAKEARVPVIVAINKIDKPGANAQRVREDLARHGLEVEEFGGEVQTVEVSGKTGAGMSDLEDAALALADVLDVRSPADGPVEGRIIESTAKASGKVATILVRRGTLMPGAVLVAGKTWTRVRTLRDASGAAQASVGPGVPTLVDGWREQPEAGDEVLDAGEEQRAKRAIAFRTLRGEAERLAQDVTVQNKARSNEAAAAQAAQAEAEATGEDAATLREAADHKAAQAKSNVLVLPIMLRGDVSGSVEAVDAYIQSLTSPLIRPKILRALVGPVSPSDVRLAELTQGVVVSFNVAIPGPIALAAERGKVPLLSGNVIYRLADDVKAEMQRRLPDIIHQKVLGEAEVLQIFHIGLGGGKGKLPVAGVRISNGLMTRGGRVRVLRGGKAANETGEDTGTRKGASKRSKASDKAEEEKVVYDGTIATLRSMKKEVAEMRKGAECGMSFSAGFASFEVGDRIQLYEEVRSKQTL